MDVTLHLDVLVEIFSWALPQYSLFRCLCRETREIKTPYDGWDSLVAQGHSVVITSRKIKWYKNGLCHRGGDLPAIIHVDGTCTWYMDGYLHRKDNLPVTEYSCGSKAWAPFFAVPDVPEGVNMTWSEYVEYWKNLVEKYIVRV